MENSKFNRVGTFCEKCGEVMCICNNKTDWKYEEVRGLLIELGGECLCDDGAVKEPHEVILWINKHVKQPKTQ
jgi:hypothetical protein